jgi:hypothetical protein
MKEMKLLLLPLGILRPMTKEIVIGAAVLILAAPGCKKSLDPGYKAALEARYAAVCSCRTQTGDALEACYATAQKEHPDPGKHVGDLRHEDLAFVHKMNELIGNCDAERRAQKERPSKSSSE